MKIAIFGSWGKSIDKWKLRGSKEEFIEACEAIGKKIASCGHTIIVGSSSTNTADFYIVSGIIKQIGDGVVKYPLINIIRPSNDIYPFNDLAKRYPRVFRSYIRTQSFWEGAHLISIKEADAVLTIGGAKGTYLAGLASIIAGKRIVPIGSFDGASEKIRQVLENIVKDSKDDFRKLSAPWSEEVLNTTLELLRAIDFPKVLLIHGRSRDWLYIKEYLEKYVPNTSVVVMEEEFIVGKTLPEKFEYLASKVDCAIVIATPDDIGSLKDARQLKPRARQNVWLETGWFWGRLSRERIIILCKGSLEIPSDLQGIELYYYREKPVEVEDKIRLFIERIRSSSQ